MSIGINRLSDGNFRTTDGNWEIVRHRDLWVATHKLGRGKFVKNNIDAVLFEINERAALDKVQELGTIG